MMDSIVDANLNSTERKEKQFVTITSIIAAIFLTGSKIIVGILTGSLGIISEALHSGLDLLAATMTYFAVKFADRPPDADHHYGHGKIENLSALFETLILLITCIWIAYEAVERLTTGRTEIIVNIWSFAVIIFSIFVDLGRSRALMRVAKKYNSQAIEADALHFSSDIFSSAVVLIGLIGAVFSIHWLDSIAALLVAIIVFIVSLRLGKRAVDALLDKSPSDIPSIIIDLSKEYQDINHVHDIKVRSSGSLIFIELNIHVNRDLTIEQAHSISHDFEDIIKDKIKRSRVHVHVEPE